MSSIPNFQALQHNEPLRNEQPLQTALWPTTEPIQPRLSVVGAGIGDPDLITLKAIKTLQTANVVLYDALVNVSLLDYAPATASRIYVGKRKGAKSFSQTEINERIVAYAKCFGHVVRLKGGDPFVFGRGLEEMQYAAERGIDTAYIPGISSVIAGAGAAGIAVTLRGASRSFWSLTATTDAGVLNPEIFTAAQTDATTVILMGLTKIREISEVFLAAGKPNWPVAVIYNASLESQHEVYGTVSDIAEKASHYPVSNPGVIILGTVVEHRIPNQTNAKVAERLQTERLAMAEF